MYQNNMFSFTEFFVEDDHEFGHTLIYFLANSVDKLPGLDERSLVMLAKAFVEFPTMYQAPFTVQELFSMLEVGIGSEKCDPDCKAGVLQLFAAICCVASVLKRDKPLMLEDQEHVNGMPVTLFNLEFRALPEPNIELRKVAN